MPRLRRLLGSLAIGLSGAIGVITIQPSAIRLEPGAAAWGRLVKGAGPEGVLQSPVLMELPGLDRWSDAQLVLETHSPSSLGVSIDAGPVQWLRAPHDTPIIVIIPATPVPGARVRLIPAEGEAPRLCAMAVHTGRPLPLGSALVALLLVTGLMCVLLARSSMRLAASLGLFASGLLTLAFAPALLYLMLPAPSALARLALPMLLLASSLALGRGGDPHAKRRFARGIVLLAAFVFGTWVRLYFMPSTGSWDTEYWKAWMMRAVSHGVTDVYGGPDALPPGRFWAQLRGKEELWKAEAHGRAFVVDYPPLAMALWRSSWWAVSRMLPAMDYAEAQNVAVKLPAVLGDVAAVGALLWTLRSQPARAAALAALYWAAPVSWLSSAVLGFLDGAYAPLLALTLVSAGRARPGWAGAWLAVACLIKPTAVVIAPAVAIALVARRSGLAKAVGTGMLVVALCLLPFALAGTLGTAVVHVYRILFQGTLSGGYPNPWWMLGHALETARGEATLFSPVKYARLDVLTFPARPLGTVLFALAAVFVAYRHRHAPGVRPVALAGAALVFSYGMLAIGVHENHPHPLFLLLLLTSLSSFRLRLVAAGAAIVYVLNMLLLSGLGRFHGLRYMALTPFVASLSGWRMALGIDLTLILALLNTALFVFLLASLGPELKRLAQEDVNAAAEGRG